VAAAISYGSTTHFAVAPDFALNHVVAIARYMNVKPSKISGNATMSLIGLMSCAPVREFAMWIVLDSMKRRPRNPIPDAGIPLLAWLEHSILEEDSFGERAFVQKLAGGGCDL